MSDSKKDLNTYRAVGFAFLPLAVVFFITNDNKAIALPFFVLAITFFILGSQKKRSEESDQGDARPTDDSASDAE